MLKVSSSLYKIPYFNVETKSLKSINRRKDDYQEVICMCREGCTNDQDGFKYSFKYTASPTIEPVSYKLKGQTWDASLNYNDIGVDIENDVLIEVQRKVDTIGTGLEPDILSRVWNRFNNWQLSDKIFQKVNSIIYKQEVYDETSYFNSFVPQITISSEIYLININWSVVYW